MKNRTLSSIQGDVGMTLRGGMGRKRNACQGAGMSLWLGRCLNRGRYDARRTARLERKCLSQDGDAGGMRRDTDLRRLRRNTACMVSAAFFFHGGIFASEQVLLNEVMFDPRGSENACEYVEIVNTSDNHSVDLAGWRIGDGTADDALEDAGYGRILGPGQYAVILDPDYFSNPESDKMRIPSEALILTLSGSTFGSGGFQNQESESVMLFDGMGNLAACYVYSPGNVQGYSDEKINFSLGDGADNWKDSHVIDGTPGYRNSVSGTTAPEKGSMTPQPNPFSPDGDGFEDETRISFQLPFEAAWVTLAVFDIQGRLVRALKGAERSGAEGSAVWNGLCESGLRAFTGIYILLLEAIDDTAGRSCSIRSTVVVAGR